MIQEYQKTLTKENNPDHAWELYYADRIKAINKEVNELIKPYKEELKRLKRKYYGNNRQN